jgi:Mrp family chromosome partitioning ATPase
MSNIFDALQRAESESSGSESPRFSLATELLQAAEQKMREADRAEPQTRVESSSPTSAAELLRAADRKMRSIVNQSTRVESVEPTPGTSSFDELERCPVLQVFIPADTRLVVVGKEDSLAAEKFRFLGVRLRQLRQSRPLKKILITSSIPQEGKSTVAANLACTLARRKQQKTLLLEGDLRRPTLA